MNPKTHISAIDKKEKYNAILKEFIQVMIFVAFLGGIALWILKDYQKSHSLYHCDAEQVEDWFGEPHFIKDGHVFAGGAYQSAAFARSGNYSMKLDASQAYGFDIDFESLRGNEIVAISVWRYAEASNKQAGQLIASIPGYLYEASFETTETDANGWQKIDLWFQLDARAEHKSMKIFCWNPSENAVWFDDLRIELIRNP